MTPKEVQEQIKENRRRANACPIKLRRLGKENLINELRRYLNKNNNDYFIFDREELELLIFAISRFDNQEG